MEQDPHAQEIYYRVHQRPAEDQGESRSLPTPVDTQLHHESVCSTCCLLFLRQQTGGIAGTCGEVQTVGDILSELLYRTGVLVKEVSAKCRTTTNNLNKNTLVRNLQPDNGNRS